IVWCARTEAIPTPRARRARTRNWPSRSSSRAGTIPDIWRAGCSRSSCTATSRAPRTSDEAFPTGFASWTYAGPTAELDRYIGYWNPYATSHADLDADTALQEEVRNAARTLLDAVRAKLEGRFVAAGQNLRPPRQK